MFCILFDVLAFWPFIWLDIFSLMFNTYNYALWDVLPNYMFLLCTGALYISNTLCSTAYILLLYICLILFFLHFQIILFSCTVYTIINFTFICFFTQLIMFSLGVYFHLFSFFLLNDNYSLCIAFMICIVSLYTVCLLHVLSCFVRFSSLCCVCFIMCCIQCFYSLCIAILCYCNNLGHDGNKILLHHPNVYLAHAHSSWNNFIYINSVYSNRFSI